MFLILILIMPDVAKDDPDLHIPYYDEIEIRKRNKKIVITKIHHVNRQVMEPYNS